MSLKLPEIDDGNRRCIWNQVYGYCDLRTVVKKTLGADREIGERVSSNLFAFSLVVARDLNMNGGMLPSDHKYGVYFRWALQTT